MIGNRKAETLKHISRLFSVVLVITALAAGQAFAGDIVDVAAKAGKFNTLLAAAKAAGLVDVLKSKGPFTVFAPTDEAFNKLPAGTVESLLKPENKAKLAAILKYHVLSGKVTADAVGKLKSGTKVATVNGAKLTVKKKAGGIYVNKSKVVKTDVMASNGVIHVIDAVLLPPAK